MKEMFGESISEIVCQYYQRDRREQLLEQIIIAKIELFVKKMAFPVYFQMTSEFNKGSVNILDHIVQVRVAVYSCGINFADILTCLGKYQEKPPLPFIPGKYQPEEVVLLVTIFFVITISIPRFFFFLLLSHLFVNLKYQ